MTTQNICNICGANYEYKDGKWRCPACGAYKPEEVSGEEDTLLYNAAQKLRLNAFDDAEILYRDVVSQYPKNSRGYWGLVLAKYGISMPAFNEFITVNMAGETVSQVYEQGKAFNLVVRASEADRSSAEKIRNLMIDDANGNKLPLSYVADVVSSTGPNAINRENVKRKVVISANAAGRDLGSVVDDIREIVDREIELPEGYHIEYGGQFESEKAASRILLLTSFMSIIVIFLLLYMQFKSAAQSGVVLLNLPLALIGGVFALLFTTGEVSIPAIIGFISLFGIATRNGMLLISHYNLLREQGHSLYDSIIHGSLDRLNPILMTALSSALALIPLAVKGDLPGNEIQSPMAKVILGGLLTSTFLNGFIVPVMYWWLHRKEADAGVEDPQ